MGARATAEQHSDFFGATGGRLDHAFANVQMLVRGMDQGIPITIIDHKKMKYLYKHQAYI
ncbi:hypothetical protein GCM10020331_047370 [Ectobacillus funiculus]